ncbi:MAG TPA: hypothetical protein VF444_19775 [Pseudonocardiaceae bacterium]
MGLFGSKAKKVTDHKVVKGLAAWAIGREPGYDECQGCGKKLPKHRGMSGEGRVCSPKCAAFVASHWK